MKKTLQTEQGQRLKMLRKSLLNQTQIQLAERLKTSSRSINRYETGETPMPEIFFAQLEQEFPLANIDWLRLGNGVMYKEGVSEMEQILSLEEPQEGYVLNSKLSCEKKLELALAEIISLKGQLRHTKLLLQSSKNQ